MRRNKYIFVMAVCLVLAAASLSIISGCGQNKAADQGEATYYCPMHPAYTSDKPGDCPICNMKLVKKDAAPEKKTAVDEHEGHKMAGPAPAEEKTLEEVCIEHKCTMNNCPMNVTTGLRPGERIICPICGEVISTASGKVVEISKQPVVEDHSRLAGPTVTISAEKQQLIGVKTEPVARKALTKVIRASGKVAYDPELVITQEEFIQAIKNEENVKDSPLADIIERAKSMTDAARNKLKLLGMSDDQISEINKTKKAQTNLYLPGRGEGVWAYVSIYEYEIGLVHPGDAVEIESVAYPGEIFSGKVVSINPVLDPITRTNQVRAEVANPDSKLKPEMFINAKIKVDLGEKLAVPESAVLNTGLRKIVYLSKENNTLESREVELGNKAEGNYEVLGGLGEGDIVVTSGNFLVDSESRLQIPVNSEHQHGQ
ncbi:MAG: efflux RND transporter periplasmic adaptor subunit [Candidatus Omnitrophota bacterium]|nr:efflux RND transporter periplasmic adaptor subunit [Candidatus Omnitrophota bacterium]